MGRSGGGGGGRGGRSRGRRRGGRKGKSSPLGTLLEGTLMSFAVFFFPLYFILVEPSSCNGIVALSKYEMALCQPSGGRNRLITAEAPAEEGFVTYFFDSSKAALPLKLSDERVTTAFTRTGEEIKKKRYYFQSFIGPEGTFMKANFSATGEVEAHVLGIKDFYRVENSKSIENSLDKVVGTSGQLSYTFEEYGEFFFWFKNTAGEKITLSLEFFVNYTQYDLRGYTAKCSGEDKCKFKDVPDDSWIITHHTGKSSNSFDISQTTSYGTAINAVIIVCSCIPAVVVCAVFTTILKDDLPCFKNRQTAKKNANVDIFAEEAPPTELQEATPIAPPPPSVQPPPPNLYGTATM